MPELPEVETIRRQLAPLVQGRTLRRVQILDPRWPAPLAPAELEDALRGRTVESLGRRGKYLVWRLSGDVHLAQHLRMTGTVLCDPDPEPAHVRVRIELGARGRRRRGSSTAVASPAAAGPGSREDGGVVHLAIVDPRRFGTGQLLLGAEALEQFFAARLGLEPFDERFTAEHLGILVSGRTAPVKAFLLDQRRVAGVGNIYADEALHRAGIHPLLPAGELASDQLERLREAVVWALQAGIEARGATIDDFRHVDGVRGSFQDRFKVHRRAGEPCERCGTPIVKLRAAGRGTYVCESCQTRPEKASRSSARARRTPPESGVAPLTQPGGLRSDRSPRRQASRRSRR